MNRKIKELYKYNKYKKDNRKILIYSIVLALLNVAILPLIAYFMLQRDILNGDIYGILIMGFTYIATTIIAFIIDTISYMKMLKVNNQFVGDFRNLISKKVQSVKLKELDSMTSGDVLELILNDTMNASLLFTFSYKDIILAIIKILVILVIMFYINIPMTLLILAIYILAEIVSLLYIDRTDKYIKEKREKRVDFLSYVNESIEGFELVKAEAIEEKRKDKLNGVLDDYLNVSVRIDDLLNECTSTYSSITFLTLAVAIFLGGLCVESGIMLYAGLILIINNSNVISENINKVIEDSSFVKIRRLSFNKIIDFIEQDSVEEKNGKDLEAIDEIEFKNVKFGYTKNETILDDLNLTINKKDKIALMGKMGCGKSTMVRLIPRFFEPDSGEILINGIDIKEYNIDSVRKKMAYVMQYVAIIKGNIIDNINYSNQDISKEEIINICKKLNLHDKIMKLKDGYETVLTPETEILSVGERQLINFARVMVKNPDVLILDEITSSLSCEAENLIINAIEEISKGRICIIIAHRKGIVEICNKIVNIDEGKVSKIEEKNNI